MRVLLGRELRAHRKSIGGVVVVIVVVDMALALHAHGLGAVTPFALMAPTVLPLNVIVAALMSARVFGAETRQRTWPFLGSLPLSARCVIVIKLIVVIIVVVAVAGLRIGVHALCGSPAVWGALLVRFAARVLAQATAAAVVASALAVCGRRGLFVALGVALAVGLLAQWLALPFEMLPPLCLTGTGAAGEDLFWPADDLVVTAVVTAAIFAVIVAAVGHLGALQGALARPFSSRKLLTGAAVFALLLHIELPPRQPARHLIPLGVVVAPGAAALVEDGKPARPLGDDFGAGHPARALAWVLDVFARADPAQPRLRVMVNVRSDYQEGASSGALIDDALVLNAHTAVTAESVAKTAFSLLFAARYPHSDDTIIFLNTAARGAIIAAADAVAAAPGAAPPRMKTMVPRLARCADLARWGAFVGELGLSASVAAAHAFGEDIVQLRGAEVAPAMLRALRRRGADGADVLAAAGVSCDDVVVYAEQHEHSAVVVGAPAELIVERVPLSRNTFALRLTSREPRSTSARATLVSWQTLDMSRESYRDSVALDVTRLADGAVLKGTFSTGTRLAVELVHTLRPWGAPDDNGQPVLRPSALLIVLP
jgi:hypothetical protein